MASRDPSGGRRVKTALWRRLGSSGGGLLLLGAIAAPPAAALPEPPVGIAARALAARERLLPRPSRAAHGVAKRQMAWWGNWPNWGNLPWWANWPNWQNWRNWGNAP